MSNKGYREVGDHEISPYQGFGGKKQMQKAQSRKRRQVRAREAGAFDLVPDKYKIWAKVYVAIMFICIVVVSIAVNV